MKTNWAHEVGLWTPFRRSTVVHGDGDRMDGFADVVIVNYELLDRHVGWLGDLGFRGMVVDEAHFIKNKTLAALPARPGALGADPRPRRPAAADGAHRHPADQRHRGLPGDLAVPRLDRRHEAARPADDRARGDRADPGRPGVLRRRAGQRDRHGHRASSQGRRGRRHPRPPGGGPAGRARRRRRPLDPRRRGRARGADGRALPVGRGRAFRRGRRGRDRPRPRPPGGGGGAQGLELEGRRRERVHDGPPDRPGQGRAGRRLRRAAGPQRRQGRVLRQARRRHGPGRADLRRPRHPLRLDPRRPDDRGRATRTSPRSSTTPTCRSSCAP